MTPRNDRTQVAGYSRGTVKKLDVTSNPQEPIVPTAPSYREQLIQRIEQSENLWNGASEEYKKAVIASLDNATDDALRIIEKTFANADVEFIATDGTSFHRNNTNYNVIYTKRFGDPRSANDINTTYWHEYGHLVDEAKVSGSGIIKNTKIGNYEFTLDGITDIINEDYMYKKAAANDINAFLVRNNLADRFEMQVNEWGETWLHYKNGEAVDLSIISFDDQKALSDALMGWFHGMSGYTDAVEYMYTIGYPRAPKWEDYFETYRTPKRNILRTRAKFNGAQEAYNEANQVYFEARDQFEQTHDMSEIWATRDRMLKEADAKEEVLGYITDTFDEGAYGAFSSVIIGGHTQSYYSTHQHGIESAANVFMSQVINDPFINSAFEDLCPSVFGLIKGVMS